MANKNGILKDDSGNSIFPKTYDYNVYNSSNISLDNILYPINSIYISTANISPAAFFGGTWEQLSANNVLWTTQNEGEGGQTVSAGLPNITGSFYIGKAGYWTNGGSASGAFSRSSSGYGNSAGQSGDGGTLISFNANNGAGTSGIYGNSTTVQPPAIKVYMWKRIS